MTTWMKVLRNVLIFLILTTFTVQFFPIISTTLLSKVSLTDEQLGNVLASVEIFLSTILAIYSLIDQKAAERRCLYDFSIEKNSLSLEGYRRFSSDVENTFVYFCKQSNQEIQTPYYGMSVEFEEKALCSVGIPLCMEVSTALNGERITFSHVRVYAKKQEQILKGDKLSQGSVIQMPIQDGRKYLVRIMLMCNHQIEEILLNSCIYLSFVLVLYDDRGRKLKKYYFVKVQNTMGESRIISVSSKNNRFEYIVKLIEQQYQLYCK